ncbi:uncharacterized protein LOC124945130 [Impatiens glandulifera]|uniref:uncharacterized protein LOC124945130 n=1 Tax=Impatiens glandulifera TaxID=253017 RepID=UPI001FB188BD|nr:uncharacterized protein LOC124945130 [Impatiens glandulifera]
MMMITTTMKTSTLRSHFFSLSPISPPYLIPKSHSNLSRKTSQIILNTTQKPEESYNQFNPLNLQIPTYEDPFDNLSLNPFTELPLSNNNRPKIMVAAAGAIWVGLALFLIGVDGEKALALGPEGPLMEEFWDNMRRYALYALTVSTGVAYAVFQPIWELLRNPISAVLVLVILGGSFYIVSQVLSAMVGVSEFSYQYSY